MLIDTANPIKLPLTNPNPYPIRVPSRSKIAHMHCPREMLDRADQMSEPRLREFHQKGLMLQAVAARYMPKENLTSEDEINKMLVGPKTAEMIPGDEVPPETLLEVIDVNPELSMRKQEQLKELICWHKKVFSTKENLGQYDTCVHILLKEGMKPISLPCITPHH
jgi:hypothetical protein